MKTTCLLLLAALAMARALVAADDPVIARYESMLEKNPSPGAVFEKVYLAYLEDGRVAELEARWTTRAATEPAYELLVGYLRDRLGRTKQAREEFEKYTRAHPDDPAGWLALAKVAGEENRLADATVALEKALALTKPPNERIDLSREIALLLERQLRADEAIAVWKNLAGEFPNDAAVAEDAASAMVAAGRFDEARALLRKMCDALDLDPTRKVRIEMSLAQVDDRQGRVAEALKAYDALLDSVSETSWLRRELRGRIEMLFRGREDLPGLADYYRRRLQTHPRDYDAAMRLSDVLATLEKADESLEWIQKAAEWAPERDELQLAVARHLIASGQPLAAVPILERLRRDRAGGDEVAELLGEAHWRAWETGHSPAEKEQALAAWRQIIPAKPTVSSLMRLAELLERHELKVEAAGEYRRALKLEPQAADARSKLALLLVDLGQKDEAWKTMDALVPERDATPADYLRLARLQDQVKRSAEALATVRAGLAKKETPDLLELEYQLLSAANDQIAALAVVDRQLAVDAERADELENRKVSLLVALKKDEETIATLQKRLRDGTITVGDARVLIRLLLPRRDTEALDGALAAALQKFPDSVGLLKLETEIARQSDDDAKVVALAGQLAEKDAAHRADWLRLIATQLQAGGKADEAIAAAGQVIAASPAQPDGYLFAAEIAQRVGKDEQAVIWLRQAIPLADSPREALTRLSQVLMGLGRRQEGIDALEQAFQAEEDPTGKLNLVGALAAAYSQAGRVDELIQRYRERQSAEGDDGWHYALYLSQIYLQLDDYASAREQLARALAAKPRDAALVRQLIQVSARESNRDELVRYQRRLAELEPSVANDLALADALLASSKVDEAWKIIEKRRADWLKDPRMLSELLLKAVPAGLGDRIQKTLDAELREHPRNWDMRMERLATLAGSDPDAAAAEALAIYRDALSDPATMEPRQGSSATPYGLLYAYGSSKPSRWRNRYAERMGTMAFANNIAGACVAQIRNPGSFGYRPGILSSQLGATAIRDLALGWYFQLRESAGKGDEARETLLGELEKAGMKHGDALATILALQPVFRREQDFGRRTPAELKLLFGEADSPRPDPALDSICLAQLAITRPASDEVKAAMRKILVRLETGPEDKKFAIAAIVRAHEALGDNDAASRLLADWVKEVDLTNNAEFYSAFSAALGEKAPAASLGVLLTRLREASAAGNAPAGVTSLLLSATQVFTFPPGGAPPAPADVLAVSDQILRHLALSRPPAGQGRGAGSFFGQQGEVACENRFLGAIDVYAARNFLQQIRGINQLAAFEKLLQRQIATLPAESRDCPAYLLALAQWESNDRKTAAAAMDALAARAKDEGMTLSAGRMRLALGEPEKALATFRGIKPSGNRASLAAQMGVVQAARALKRTDEAKAAITSLAAMPLTQYDRQVLATTAGSLGLTELASRLGRRGTSSSGSGGLDQTVQQISTLLAQKKDAEARKLVEGILAQDPLTTFRPGEREYVADRTFSFAARLNMLPGLVADWEKQLASAPDSQKLHLLLALAGEDLQGTNTDAKRLPAPGWPLPTWMKIVRHGDTVEGFLSRDGLQWTSAGTMKISAGRPVFIGPALTSHERKKLATAKFDHIAWSGAIEPAAAGEAGWESRDIGTIVKGGTIAGPDSVELTASGEDIEGHFDEFRYCFRRLAGDGEMTARLTSLDHVNEWTKAGLMIRDELESSAVFGFVERTPVDLGLFQWRERADRSLSHWRRLAELRSGDAAYQLAYAHALVEAEQPELAFPIYREQFEKNPQDALNNSGRLVSAFRNAGALDELVTAAEKMSPQRFGVRPYEYLNFLSNLSENLAGEKDYVHAIRLARKRLDAATETGSDVADSSADLIALLIRANHQDEAKAELRRALALDDFKPVSNSLRSAATPAAARNSLNNSASYQGVRMYSSGQRFLAMAEKLGVTKALADELAKGAKDDGDVDYMALALRIAARDPGALEEIRAAMKSASMTSYEARRGAEFCIDLLWGWPGGRPLALQWMSALVDRYEGMNGSVDERCMAAARRLEMLDDLGDSARADAACRKLVETLRSVIPASPNLYYGEKCALAFAISQSLRAGRLADAKELLALVPPNSSDRPDFRLAAGEIEFSKGGMTPLPTIWWTSHAGRRALAWELSPPPEAGCGVLGRRTKALDGKFTLELLAGPAPNAMKVVRKMENADSRGTLTFSPPKDARCIQARLSGGGMKAPATSRVVPIWRSENLIRNPNFLEAGEGGGIKGWSSPALGAWFRRGDGPCPGAPVRAWEAPAKFDSSYSWRGELVSERIPLRPEKTYGFEGWFRRRPSEGDVDVRLEFFDDSGKMVGNFSRSPGAGANWNCVAMSIGGKGSDVTAPQNAKFVQITLAVEGRIEISGLFLGEI
jgi:predicted Zn-dependent protease